MTLALRSTTMTAPNDVDLVRAASKGDCEALAMLYDRYAPLLLALGQRMMGSRQESEDLVHDVFLEVWRRASDYEPRRGTVRSWLCIRMRSRGLDRLKSPARALRSFEAPDEDTLPASQCAPCPDGARVRRVLAALPSDQRVILEQAYFDGQPLSEIATQLGVPIGTVKSRLSRALLRLRGELDPHGIHHEGDAP